MQCLLPIDHITAFTMQDFPQKTACILWFSGCNMRCHYCHNPHLVKHKTKGNIDSVMSFLEKRRGLLDGVVLSGGEASLYPDLPYLIQHIKALGYAVKLDTNGLRPDVVAHLLTHKSLDYIALDYKAPADKFQTVTRTKLYHRFSQTLDLLCAQTTVNFEVRTTVHTHLINEDDVSAMMYDLDQRGFQGTYAIQNFISHNETHTLGRMPPQTRLLDRHNLYTPFGFHVEFRNF